MMSCLVQAMLHQTCCSPSICVLQRKGTTDADPQEPSQAIRDYKGHSRQMITMAFLEEGGYFDVPIQVSTIAECAESCLLTAMCAAVHR